MAYKRGKVTAGSNIASVLKPFITIRKVNGEEKSINLINHPDVLRGAEVEVDTLMVRLD